MRTIGNLEFPERGDSLEVVNGWVPETRRMALATHVLVVANSRIEGTWAAYIGVVPGVNHDREWQEVRKSGSKLDKHIALAMFPLFDGVPYAK